MEQQRQEQLLRALEIIAGIQPPPTTKPGDVPNRYFGILQAIAARSLRAPETSEGFYKGLEIDEWSLPLPYQNIENDLKITNPGSNNMSRKTVTFSVVIEIEANVDAMTNEESIAFMLERLAEMTIRSIEGTEEHEWDCAFSNVELLKEGE